jgi:hypothetical protein
VYRITALSCPYLQITKSRSFPGASARPRVNRGSGFELRSRPPLAYHKWRALPSSSLCFLITSSAFSVQVVQMMSASVSSSQATSVQLVQLPSIERDIVATEVKVCHVYSCNAYDYAVASIFRIAPRFNTVTERTPPPKANHLLHFQASKQQRSVLKTHKAPPRKSVKVRITPLALALNIPGNHSY